METHTQSHVLDINRAIREMDATDSLSVAIIARQLVRSGMKLDEQSLNQEILGNLLKQADIQQPESLRKLCAELVEQGYGPKQNRINVPKDNLIVINPIKIHPSVQGQMPGKGWAFIWELDRPCENFNWLIGSHITVDGRLYTVQGIENMPDDPHVGDRLTLLCSAVPIDEH